MNDVCEQLKRSLNNAGDESSTLTGDTDERNGVVANLNGLFAAALPSLTVTQTMNVASIDAALPCADCALRVRLTHGEMKSLTDIRPSQPMIVHDFD